MDEHKMMLISLSGQRLKLIVLMVAVTSSLVTVAMANTLTLGEHLLELPAEYKPRAAQPPQPIKVAGRKPGCHLVGNTRLMKLPGCLPFNLTTNICRGFCMSYAVPATDDIMASFPDMTQDFTSYLDNINMRTHEDKPVLLSEEYVLGRDSRSSNLDGGPEDVASGHQADLDNDIDSEGPIKLDEFQAEEVKKTKQDIVSVSQCCNMINSDNYEMMIPCHEGPRKVIFKMAYSCECLFCKAY